MINVSDRLLAIADLVSDDEKIFDIGCDHGLLDIYLTINKNCSCTACDVSDEIVLRAKNNFIKHNLESKIGLFVGNGFDDLNIDFSNTIVLSGMGTTTILKILHKNKSNKIICQTNTDLYFLRKGICDMGYHIIDENIVFDNNRYYVTIKFSIGCSDYCYDDYLLGPILRKKKSSLFDEYVKYMYNKNIQSYEKALEFNNPKLLEVKKLIGTLKKYM